MKKFLITFLILLVVGGAVFFFGWAQFKVPPGAYGVITSKTHGVDPELVKSGEFRWLWYKLIPTNVKIIVFNLEPLAININYNSTLPSGESFASFAGLEADFSWQLRAVISFNLNYLHLTNLVGDKNIANQEALDAYLQETGRNIESLILRTLSSLEMDTLRLENILSGNQDSEINSTIAKAFPEIQDFVLTIQSAQFPDFALYRQVRLLYEEFLQRQREIISAGFGRRAESHIASRLHFDELERYGELLTKYPVLLEYIKMQGARVDE